MTSNRSVFPLIFVIVFGAIICNENCEGKFPGPDRQTSIDTGEQSWVSSSTIYNPNMVVSDSTHIYRQRRSVQTDISGSNATVQRIPGTSLFTGVFYQIRLKRINNFPNNILSWKEHVSDAGHKHAYLHADSEPSTSELYAPGGELHLNSQWMILPTEVPNAYLLKNRQAPEGFVTWTQEKSPSGHFIQLSKFPDHRVNYLPNGKWRQDAMILIDGTEIPNHFRLHLKVWPEKIITWTDKYGSQRNKFLQVDISAEMHHYYPTGKWQNDSLFQFSLINVCKP